SLLTSGFACEIIHRNNPLSALKSAIQMKSPITAEMIRALMPCLLIPTPHVCLSFNHFRLGGMLVVLTQPARK
ncbi:hypothetical protein, partial [Klebsiella pneumoniae]|uniref:hypothetical protein n=1 Tax=Klebsiella pneumoniae TaxID=573 RepID=UPI001FABAA41